MNSTVPYATRPARTHDPSFDPKPWRPPPRRFALALEKYGGATVRIRTTDLLHIERSTAPKIEGLPGGWRSIRIKLKDFAVLEKAIEVSSRAAFYRVDTIPVGDFVVDVGAGKGAVAVRFQHNPKSHVRLDGDLVAALKSAIEYLRSQHNERGSQ